MKKIEINGVEVNHMNEINAKVNDDANASINVNINAFFDAKVDDIYKPDDVDKLLFRTKAVAEEKGIIMICTLCGADNSKTLEAADGFIYCIECSDIFNDCCLCGMRKGTVKTREIETFIEDDSLMFCEFCTAYVKAENERLGLE